MKRASLDLWLTDVLRVTAFTLLPPDDGRRFELVQASGGR